jgi:hypothetical protein
MASTASSADQCAGIGYFARSAARSTQTVAGLVEHHDSSGTLSTLPQDDADLLLDEVQNIVLQGGAVAQRLWPAGTDLQAGAERLRARYGLTEDSALRTQDLRGAIERFEAALRACRANDAAEPPVLQYVGVEADAPPAVASCCRAYFVDIGVLALLGARYDIEPLTRELWRIAYADRDPAPAPCGGPPP